MPVPSAPEIERFRAAIALRFGLQFDAAKTAALAELLEQRAAAYEDAAAYLARLERLDEVEPRARHEEVRALSRALTVQETYFFRHREQFRAFFELALPQRLAARAPLGQVHVLSAGCASGEEAYSLAILVREAGLGDSGRVSIRAVDLCAEGLERSARGVYGAWALRETPDDVRRRWFAAEGREFALDRRVRAAVTFEERNLVREDPGLWPRGFYDVVFCRNVLMYFTFEAARAVVERIAGALAPGGFLFMGHAETLRGVSDDFGLHQSHGAFYYRRKSGSVPAIATGERPPEPLDLPSPLTLAPLPWTDEWVGAVERSAERIRALAAMTFAGAAERVDPSEPSAVEVAFEHLKAERFARGLAVLAQIDEARRDDPSALLLRAVLLVHTGALAEAEGACRRLLAVDAHSTGAHYVLALCRESSGDLDGARRGYETASTSDPTFAMPRLHLGLLARRAGDPEGARRAFESALELVAHEDPARLVLFGGGFGRDGLSALCRAELKGLGDRR